MLNRVFKGIQEREEQMLGRQYPSHCGSRSVHYSIALKIKFIVVSVLRNSHLEWVLIETILIFLFFFKCMGLFPLRKKFFKKIIAFILALFISHVSWQLQTWMLM